MAHMHVQKSNEMRERDREREREREIERESGCFRERVRGMSKAF